MIKYLLRPFLASNRTYPSVREHLWNGKRVKEAVLSRVKRMVAVLATLAVLVGAVGSAALAVNDPLVPGEECSASTQAVGHPAFANQQDNPQGAKPALLVEQSWGIHGREGDGEFASPRPLPQRLAAPRTK
jgi:hypothetical protein